MVGDGDSTDDIRLPLVFLFSREGAVLTAALEEHQNVDVLLLPKQRQLERDNVEKSVAMNVKLRLAEEEEEETEGPTLELVFTEGEMLLKEKELGGEEEQQFCTQSAGKD